MFKYRNEKRQNGTIWVVKLLFHLVEGTSDIMDFHLFSIIRITVKKQQQQNKCLDAYCNALYVKFVNTTVLSLQYIRKFYIRK